MPEIIPDDMPDWADEAMERGQLFQELVGRMDAVATAHAELEAKLAAIAKLPGQWRENTKHMDFPHAKQAIQEANNCADDLEAILKSHE